MTLLSWDPRTATQRHFHLDETDDKTVDRVIAAAHQAHRDGLLGPTAIRRTLLNEIGVGLREAADRLVSAADSETALGEVRLAAELGRMIMQLQHAAEHIEQRREAATSQERVMSPGGEILLITTPVGIGVVANFAASNFPFGFGVLGTDTASAIAAGCPVIVKAHPAQPETSSALAGVLYEAIARSGLDPAVAAVVHGVAAGRHLVRSRHTSAVTFTGSRRGAEALIGEMSTRATPVPFFGELGSVNPVIVSDDCVEANGESFVAGLFESFTLGNGQFCTKPGVVLASPWAVDQLWTSLRTLVERHQGGWMLTESIAAAYRTSLDVIGRHCADVALGALPTAGFACRAALGRTDGATWNSVEALRDEHFGPLLLLVAVSNADQRGSLLRDIGGTLATCIHCEPDEAGFAAQAAAQAASISGRIVWQGFPTGVAVSAAMHHGGPWPAATVASATSVGARSIDRLQRPLCIQTRAS